MARTPEQIVADTNLTAAIEAVMAAYEYTDPGIMSVTLEYVVVVAQQTYSGEESAEEAVENSFCTLYRDGEVPHTRALGLLTAAQRTLEAQRG
jgi:hypothetical protein